MKKRRRKIDSYGKLFLLIESKKNTTIYCLSVILKNKVNKEILKKAIDKSLDEFRDFKVTLKKKVFRYYLEENEEKFILKEQGNDNMSSFSYKNNNGYLFRITYDDCRVNFDFYHMLTDGTGALEFVKDVVERYFDLLNGKEDKVKEVKTCSDGYKNNTIVKFKKGKRYTSKGAGKSFIIKEDKLKNAWTLTHISVSLNDIKEYCRMNDITITQYIAAVISKAIFEVYNEKMGNMQKIKISIPVNLRKMFNYNTSSNFFDYFNLNITKKDASQPEDILYTNVNTKFKEALDFDNFVYKIRVNAKILNQKLTKIIPFYVKKNIVYVFNNLFVPKSTILLSNIGNIDYDKNYIKYINNTVFVSNAEEKTVKCTVCSFNDKLNISFVTKFKERKLEKAFYEILCGHGLNAVIREVSL